jgi:hypothetical protein
MKPGLKTYPGAVYDVKAAVQYVRAEAATLGVDSNRIALMGDSSGAHLSALVALAGEGSRHTPPNTAMILIPRAQRRADGSSRFAGALVGRFQYHFGRIEQKIDQAVIKLLDLDDKAGPIVTGSVDFARKLNFVRTSAYQQAVNDDDKRFADHTCDRVFKINNVRQIIIHSSFEPASNGGVQFRTTAAKDGRVRVMIRSGMTRSSPSTPRK